MEKIEGPGRARNCLAGTVAQRNANVFVQPGSYRAIDATIAQNAERKPRRLTLRCFDRRRNSLGEGTISTMKLVADNVQGVIIPGRVAEEARRRCWRR